MSDSILAPVQPVTMTEFELNQLFHREHTRVLYGGKTAEDFRVAISGHGPLAGEWADKPHRLVYDLLRVIDAYHQRAAEAKGEL